jgi:putative membrane protein
MFRRLLWHWLVLAFGLYLLTVIKPLGISADTAGDLALAALVLIIANTFLKPVLVIISLPLVLLSLGLFLLVINAIILDLLPHLVHGFHVPGFWSAFFGALILSLITGLFSGWDKRERRTVSRPAPARRDDVIDI